MYARRSETPCCFLVGVPTKERSSSSTFLRAQRNSHIRVHTNVVVVGVFFCFFFFFRLRSLLFSLFLVPRRRVKCSTHCFHVVFFWIKALLLKKSHFFPVLVVVQKKKKVQTLESRFCPQKRKRSGKNISPIHTLFFLSFFFTLIIQSSQNFLGF